ncbi:MAG: isocitrate/isopropylmalate family dehydrogenase [Verrucomicrobiota bacterium]
MSATDTRTYKIANLPGDGIGAEVAQPAVAIVNAALSKAGTESKIDFIDLEAGAALYQRTGESLPQEVLDACESADAILLGAMGLPSIRYPDGREIAPQLDLRERFGLYAGVRPVKSFPGMKSPLSDPRARDIDFILIRESTEGLFASRGKVEMSGSQEAGDEKARDFLQVSRKVSQRLFEFSFALGRQRKKDGHPGVVTCVDKANVLGSMAYFRKIFYETHKAYTDVEANHAYVDATALNMIKCPWAFDVLVTENMYGDILSDAGAALMGGMGMAPSADIGDHNAVFQPCHGSAPDIAGEGRANPVAMILSAGMMLEWLENEKGAGGFAHAGKVISEAVENAFANSKLHPCEFGGTDGTREISEAVLREV